MTSPIETPRLVLTTLDPSDAPAMVSVLADADLYSYIGGEPPTLAQLEARYEAQVAGPTDPGERWLKWIVRLGETHVPIGFVQATVDGHRASVAWVVGSEWQRRGFASEAATAMCRWLREQGVTHLSAHIHPQHSRSARVAAAIGMQRSDQIDAEGEEIWVLTGGAQ